MIRYRYLSSFDRSIRRFPAADMKHVERAIEQLLAHFSGGPRPIGLGLRKVSPVYWEVRATIDRRILFRLDGGLVTFVLAGNHDEIRRAIR